MSSATVGISEDSGRTTGVFSQADVRGQQGGMPVSSQAGVSSATVAISEDWRRIDREESRCPPPPPRPAGK